MQLKPKLYIPDHIFGNTVSMHDSSLDVDPLHQAPYQGYPVFDNLGADATPPTPPATFFEDHKNAIIVGIGCVLLASVSALFIHHAGKVHREQLALRRNPKLVKNMFIPQHIKDYAKASAKLAPDHLRYYKGALGF